MGSVGLRPKIESDSSCQGSPVILGCQDASGSISEPDQGYRRPLSPVQNACMDLQRLERFPTDPPLSPGYLHS
jgi:hypothetical protein